MAALPCSLKIHHRGEGDKRRDRSQCSEAAEPDGEEAGFCLGLGSGELGFAALILGFQFWAGGAREPAPMADV